MNKKIKPLWLKDVKLKKAHYEKALVVYQKWLRIHKVKDPSNVTSYHSSVTRKYVYLRNEHGLIAIYNRQAKMLV